MTELSINTNFKFPTIQDNYKSESAVAAKTQATQLNTEQMDAARKIIEEKLVTQFDSAQFNDNALKPVLREPLNNAGTNPGLTTEKKSSTDSYNELMAELIVLLGDATIDNLKARAEMYTKISSENGSASEEVLAQVDAEEQAYDEAKLADAAAKQTVDMAQEQVNQLTGQLELLQQTKTELEKQIDDPETTPEEAADLNKQLSNTNTQIAQKQASLSEMQVTLTNAKRTSQETSSVLASRTAELNNSLNYLEQLNKNGAQVNTAQEQSINGTTDKAALLMAQMIAIMGETNEENMKANIAFAQKTQEAQQIKLANDAEEVEKEQEKSKQMQDTMGCIGKIVSAIVTVVSVVAAVFTGGASLAVAAIGIALMASDQIYQKVTGNDSFIAAALKPIVEHVLMPIIQAITNVISSVLEALGVSDEVSEIIASVMAVVVMITGAVAASIAVKKLPIKDLMSAVGDALKPMLESVMGTLTKVFKPLISGVGKLTNELENMLSKISNSIMKFIGQIFGDAGKSKINVLKEFFDDEVKIKSLGNKLNLSADVLALTNAGIDSAGAISAGVFEQRISDVMADITKIMSASATMKLFTDGVVDQYSQTMTNINMLMNNAADMAGEEQNVGRAILSHTRA